MPKQRTWTDEELTQAVKESFSVAQVLRALELSPVGGSYGTINRHVKRLGLDVSHFTGQASNSGSNYRQPRPPVSDEDVFREKSTYTNRKCIKDRLLRLGIPNECSRCGNSTWMGEKLSLHLEHINGCNDDHRRENLCLLCPNCHSLTPTFAGRNIKRKVRMA